MTGSPRVSFAELELALNAIYQPTTPAAERQRAQQICDAFKNPPSEAARRGIELYSIAFRERKPETLRLFALSAVETAVSQWDSLEVSDKTFLKNTMISLVQSGTRPLTEEATFIKSKVVTILSDMAVREWPQYWSEFGASMLGLLRDNVTSAELALRVFSVIVENCTQSDFNTSLPPRRRNEILTQVRNQLHEILLLSFGFLEQADQLLSGDPVQAGTGGALALASIEMLTAMSDLIPMQSLIEERIVQAVSEFTRQHREVRVQATSWACVASFAKKSIPERSSIDGPQWVSCLLEPFKGADLPGNLPLLAFQDSRAVWPRFILNNTDRVSTEFSEIHQLMAVAVSSMLVSHFSVMLAASKGGSSMASQHLSTLMELLLRMHSHPSFQIRSLCFPGVQSVLKSLSNEPAGSTVVDRSLSLLMRVLADQLIRVGHPGTPKSAFFPCSEFSIQDYDDAEEFEQAFKASSCQLATCFRTLVKCRPLETVRFVRWRIEIALLSREADSLAVSDEKILYLKELGKEVTGPVGSPREEYLFSTLVLLVDAVAPGISRDAILAFGAVAAGGAVETDIAGVAMELKVILDTVLSFRPSSSNEWLGSANVLGRLGPCYGSPPSGPATYVGPALERLFQCATYRSAKEIASNSQGKALSESTLVARRRACTALVEICDKLSHGAASSAEIRTRLASLLPTFCNQVLAFLNNASNSPLSYEKLMLYEVLVLVSNTLNDSSQQDAFLSDIVCLPLQQWQDVQVKQLADSPAGFVAALCPSHGLYPVLLQAKRALTLITGIARRSKSPTGRPFAKHWSSVLPAAFSMIRTLHYLWQDRDRFRDILYIHPDELRVLLGINPKKHSSESASSSDDDFPPKSGVTEKDLVASQHMLTALRDSLYSALALAARYGSDGLFRLPTLLEQVPSTVLSDIESMENRHLSKLLGIALVPIAQNCPAHLVQSFLVPILDHVASRVSQRLSGSWALLGSGGQSTQGYNDAWSPSLSKALDDEDFLQDKDQNYSNLAAQMEVARDSSIRGLGSAYVDFLSGVLSTTPEDYSADTRELALASTSVQILESERVSAAVLLSLSACISSPDAQCCNKAVYLTKRIYHACLLQMPKYHRYACDQLFCALFGSIASPKTNLLDSTKHEILNTLCKLWTFALSCKPSIEYGPAFEIDPASPLRGIIHGNLISGIPGMNAAEIASVESGIATSSSEKGKRAVVKDFIQTCSYQLGRARAEGTPGLLTHLPTNQEKQAVRDLPPLRKTRRKSPFEPHSWHDASGAWDTSIQDLFRTD